MFLFIAVPIVSVLIQSFHTSHEASLVETTSCGPFGCTTTVSIDHEAARALRADKPLGKFVGWDVYLDRRHLAIQEVREAWATADNMRSFFLKLNNLPFYRAMFFTLTYTFVVTPFMLLFGFMIALGVNSLHQRIKGILIFFSLLPMIVSPLIGSLVLFWMIDTRGIIGSALQWIFSNQDLSLKASAGLTWIMLIVYGIWHAIPFSFIVLYAGLQTVPKDTLESSQIDGASRWQQVRYVIIPHLLPLITFIALMQLMDNFRVLEPIVGFNSEAHAVSLSWFIFNDLGGETRLLSSAAASSILTIIGVSILLAPVLIRNWREFNSTR